MIANGIAPGSSAFYNFNEAPGADDSARWREVQRLGLLGPLFVWIKASVQLSIEIELGPLVILSFAPRAMVLVQGRGQLTHRGRLESSHGACFVAQPGAVRLLGTLDVIDVGWWSGVDTLPFRCALAALHAAEAPPGSLPPASTARHPLALEAPPSPLHVL